MSNSNNFQIREAIPADAEALRRYLMEFTAERCPFVFQRDSTPSIADEEQFIRRHAETPNSVLFLGEVDQRIIGMLDFLTPTRPELAHGGALGMSVLREFRRRGIGRALLNRLIEWAEKRPMLRRVELEVFATNVAAIGLYEQFGFVLEGRRRGAVRIGGTYVDVLCMARVFHERP
jgi:RimJ/RimL family protein N-acetyltransferase